VLTTHSDPRGVAKGVVDVFRNVLEQSDVDPKEVIFLAHSTTQATNALLEGDVAGVGVIGMSTRVESLLAKSQSAMKPIELAPGRHLTPVNRFLTTETLTDDIIRKAIDELRAEGAKVVVASSAFGVGAAITSAGSGTKFPTICDVDHFRQSISLLRDSSRGTSDADDARASGVRLPAGAGIARDRTGCVARGRRLAVSAGQRSEEC